MHKDRAERFCASARSSLVEWEVVASGGVIFVHIRKPDADPLLVAMKPDDASDFREALGYALDRALAAYQ